MPRFVKSRSFYNRTLMGKLDSARDDARLNKMLDELRNAGAEIVDIKPTASGGWFKLVLTYVVIYDAPEAVR